MTNKITIHKTWCLCMFESDCKWIMQSVRPLRINLRYLKAQEEATFTSANSIPFEFQILLYCLIVQTEGCWLTVNMNRLHLVCQKSRYSKPATMYTGCILFTVEQLTLCQGNRWFTTVECIGHTTFFFWWWINSRSFLLLVTLSCWLPTIVHYFSISI